MFDDGLDIGEGRVANNAAVTGGVVEAGGDESAGRGGIGLAVDECGDVFGPDEGTVAVQDGEESAERFELIAAGEHGVAGAKLLGLMNEADAARGDGGLHFVRLVARRRRRCAPEARKPRADADRVADQGVTAGAMEHFGLAGFHAGSEAGRENDDCDVWVHRFGRLIGAVVAHVLGLAAEAAFTRKTHGDAGDDRRVVAHFFIFFEEIGEDDFDAQRADCLSIVLDRLGGCAGIAGAQPGTDRSGIQDRIVELEPRGMVEDGADVVGRASRWFRRAAT